MIVPMKKVTLYALKQDKDALLVALQRSGELMVVATEDAVEQEGLAEAQSALNDTRESLVFIDRNLGKRSMLEPKVGVDKDVLFSCDAEAEDIQARLTGIEKGISDRESRISALRSQIEALLPWLGLDVPVEKLRSTEHTTVLTGMAPGEASAEIQSAVEANDGVMQTLSTGADGSAYVIYCHNADRDELIDALKDAGLNFTSPPSITGLPSDAKTQMEKEADELSAEITDLYSKAAELKDQRGKIEVLYDKRATTCDRLSTPTTATVYTFCITGWARADREQELKKAIESVTDAYILTLDEPGEGEQPPTLTKNNWFVQKFESVTDMFSRPDPNEVDPNPVMAPWYWFIFGMMMGDVGYGVVMLLLIGLFRWKKKPTGEFGKLVSILFYGSFTTILWGVLFGSYFGAELYPPVLMSPLQDPVTLLIICLGIGLLHMFCGMTLAMINSIRNGDIAGAVFDQLSWMVLLSGICLLFLPGLSNVGMGMAIGGAVVILFTAGRKNKGIKKLTGGLGGLYGIMNYVSDILSYSRILALALSTGVAGMVFNLMAGMVQGSAVGFVLSILIYLVGHVFNLVMGLLSAYVHTTRLQYIEFFGKFYTGNGYAFKPMSAQTRFSMMNKK